MNRPPLKPEETEWKDRIAKVTRSLDPSDSFDRESYIWRVNRVAGIDATRELISLRFKVEALSTALDETTKKLDLASARAIRP